MREKVINNICNIFNTDVEEYDNIVTISQMIKDSYKSIYNSKYLFNDSTYFMNLKFKLFIEDIDKSDMISKKVIRRNNDILLNKKHRNSNPDLYDYCIDLSKEFSKLVDMELFYMMEYCSKSNINLTEHELSCLDFMKSLGNFYLEETNELFNIINNNDNYSLKRNK
ncbi:MAG: hypothetical protein IJ574_04175 [Bacilli bacterium]|nr:hypothetical protein [Bacilli bacterium]